MVSISQAVMLADFETGLDGFSAINTPVATLAVATTAGAVTSGSQCLQITTAGSNYWSLLWTAPTVPAKLGTLSFDTTMFVTDWPAQPWTKFPDKIAINIDGSWDEILLDASHWKNRDGTATSADWGAWSGDCVKTCTVDLSGFDMTDATTFSITISINCGTAGIFYLDNFHFVDQPNTPNPPDGGFGGLSTNLSWENATDSLNAVTVWFGIPPEPNLADPNTILNMDTYKTLLSQVYTEANPGATSTCPNANIGTLTDGQEYTWCVESDPNTIPVLFWTFTANPNEAPIANAGADQDLYLSGEPNYIVATLDGSATSDDGLIAPLTYTWTQTAGPTVTFDSPNTAITTVTLTDIANTVETWNAPAAAAYVFELTVDDGQIQDTDSVAVTLSTNSCVASVEAGGFYFYGDIAGPAGAGDENRDCKIDLYDFAEMALNWLGCTNTFEGCD